VEKRIERLLRLSSARDSVIGLGGGLPAEELFPRRGLTHAFVSALGGPGALQ
jgi:hypothetical protein